MSKLVIRGGKPLCGTVSVQGSKNAVLPILAASILCTKGVTVIHNCPDLDDVTITVKILRFLGARVKRDGHTITVDARSKIKHRIPKRLMQKLRSSIIFMGAITARNHRAKISAPGGCKLGARPIDLHKDALRALACDITEKRGYIYVNGKNRRSSEITLRFPSVGATENILLTSCMTGGVTVLHNAACEPEIVDLANFLNAMGASITGAGTPDITVTGVPELHGTVYTVMPDRIVAITYLCCAAVTGGNIYLSNTVPDHLETALSYLAQCGCLVEAEDSRIHLSAPKRLTALAEIETSPYPGFPTDAQSLFLALLSTAKGTSIICERIFESRFKTADELSRMGADIKIKKDIATIYGKERLSGAQVSACDLRGGAAMVIAALAAEGTTEIDNVCYIDRGYEALEKNLQALGASVKRI
ncbi:MAG: UDP-N-acetylglucosamine 1-carboxyvinyltransferase [Ruminococcaceae bacterium]|nr:UDP-N-acetylglucosamine 1-carboxyvinyltransferase [Oscillospiraceae bacterium]